MNKYMFYEKEFEFIAKLNPFDFSKYNLNKKRELINKRISFKFDYPIKVKNETLEIKTCGKIDVLFFYPNDFDENSNKEYPIVYYVHGGGWVLDCGDYKIPSEVCHFTNSIVLYPKYSLSPEAKFPQAIEEIYEILCLIKENAKKYKIDINKLSTIGDCVGGNLAFSLALLCKFRNGPKINKQILFNPPTGYEFDTPSYLEYHKGYFLGRLESKWCYDQYLSKEEDRSNIFLNPLNCTNEQLSNLPKTLIIQADYDVLKDDGNKLSKRLYEAGVEVTLILFKSTTHSFLIFDYLKNTNVSKLALKVVLSFLLDNNNSKL